MTFQIVFLGIGAVLMALVVLWTVSLRFSTAGRDRDGRKQASGIPAAGGFFGGGDCGSSGGGGDGGGGGC